MTGSHFFATMSSRCRSTAARIQVTTEASGSVRGSTGTRRLYGLLPAIGAVAAGQPLRPHSELDRRNEFDARFDEAVDTIYRSGQQQPVAFWHGAAIAMWTMMNVNNSPLDLAQSQPLPNTGYGVVRGKSAGRLDAARLEWSKLN